MSKKTRRGAHHRRNPAGSKLFKRTFRAQFGRRPSQAEIEARSTAVPQQKEKENS
jgi:hypothetical protein